MNVRKRPCAECPWSRDTPPGQFPAERYGALANTTGEPGAEADLRASVFACHKSSEAETMPCAGWLAAVGLESLHVRLLVVQGEIPAETLSPGPDWPPLFESYAEMATTQAGGR